MRVDPKLLLALLGALVVAGLAFVVASFDRFASIVDERLAPLSLAAASHEAKAGEPASERGADARAAILRLLGDVGDAPRIPKTGVSVVPAETPMPVESVADWIKYIGNAMDANGVKIYYFKDEKGGILLKLAIGEERDGWMLVDESGSSFSIMRNGAKYIVKKGK